MNSYNNKNHNNNISKDFNKTNSTKSGFDLIVISLVTLYKVNLKKKIQKKISKVSISQC